MSKSRKRPQDRKPKAAVVEAAASDFAYTFVHDGAEYALPHPSKGSANIATGIVRAAILRPTDQMAQMALGFAMLEACDTDGDAVEALYAKPIGESTALIQAWMASAGDSVPQL